MKLAILVLLLAQGVRPTGRGGMMVKPVICKTLDEARGKAGAELARAIESAAVELARQNYALAALLAGDPPIACFRSLSNPSDLPRGAR